MRGQFSIKQNIAYKKNTAGTRFRQYLLFKKSPAMPIVRVKLCLVMYSKVCSLTMHPDFCVSFRLILQTVFQQYLYCSGYFVFSSRTQYHSNINKHMPRQTYKLKIIANLQSMLVIKRTTDFYMQEITKKWRSVKKLMKLTGLFNNYLDKLV